MNYIKEINMFYDWLETNPISDSSIVLWHALMNINNKCGWKTEFAVAISSIQNKTGLSKSSILRARNMLQQAQRITFKSRTGQLSSLYTLIAFHTDTQTVTQSVTQSGAQTVTQTDTILKLKETKPLFNCNGHAKENFSDLTEIELKNSIEYLDRVAQKKFSEGDLKSYFEAFKIQYSTEFYHNRQKVINHFRDWVKKQKNGTSAITTSNKTNRDRQADANASLMAKLRAVTGTV